MTISVHRLLLEAGAVAANYRSAVYRAAAAREVAGITLNELAGDGEAKARLLLAVREAVGALALADSPECREFIAAGLTALVKAARVEPSANLRKVGAPGRRWWVEVDDG